MDANKSEMGCCYAEDVMRSQFGSSVWCHRLGVLKYEIRRSRTKNDPKALTSYVLMSEMFSKPELAWKDAQARLEGKSNGR